jgi:HEAT repeat protein
MMPRGDRFPAGVDITKAKLSRTIRVRFELERLLRRCANEPVDKSIRLTDLHVKVLLAMLTEYDSPLSASLRASAAGVVGAAGITEAAPLLRRMALDEGEDPQTRANAADSFIRLGVRVTSADLTRLLDSDSPRINATACIAALESGNDRLVALAETWYRKGDGDEARQRVQRRVPRLRDRQRTSEDD